MGWQNLADLPRALSGIAPGPSSWRSSSWLGLQQGFLGQGFRLGLRGLRFRGLRFRGLQWMMLAAISASPLLAAALLGQELGQDLQGRAGSWEAEGLSSPKELKGAYRLKMSKMRAHPVRRGNIRFHLQGELDAPNEHPNGQTGIAGRTGVSAQRRSLAAGSSLAIEETAEDLKQKALQFFAQETNFLGIESAEEMSLHTHDRDAKGGSHLRFHRLLRGIRLYPMEVIAHFDREGRLNGINGHIVRPDAAMLAAAGGLPGRGRTLLKPERVKEVVSADLGAGAPIFSLLEPAFVEQAPYIVWRVIARKGERAQAEVRYRIADDRQAAILRKRWIIRHGSRANAGIRKLRQGFEGGR